MIAWTSLLAVSVPNQHIQKSLDLPTGKPTLIGAGGCFLIVYIPAVLCAGHRKRVDFDPTTATQE